VNGRSYRLPQRPTVVVCYDACRPAYIEQGLADNILPTIAALRPEGCVGQTKVAAPTFTNRNNVSIVTGLPSAVHGIAGNYVLDRRTGEERMITDAAMLRCGTLLPIIARAGVRDAAVTAKGDRRTIPGNPSSRGGRPPCLADGIGGLTSAHS
jgi:phosphonoacetate hydrolase